MKNIRPFLTPVLCFAAAWGLTLAIRGRMAGPAPGSPSPDNRQSRSNETLREKPRRISPGKLAEDFSTRPMSDWAGLWWKFAATCTAEDLRDLPRLPVPGSSARRNGGSDILRILGAEELAVRTGSPSGLSPASFAALAETRPEAAWKSMRENNWISVSTAVLRTLAARSPEETLRKFRTLPQADRDPFENPGERESNRAGVWHTPLGVIFGAWARKDPRAAAAAITALPAEDRIVAFNEVGMTWAFRDGPAAIRHLLEFAPSGDLFRSRHIRLDVMLRASFRTHPEETSRLLATTPKLRKVIGEPPALYVALAPWAEADPDAAVAWVLEPGNEKDRESKVAYMLPEDPETAAGIIRSLAKGGFVASPNSIRSIYFRDPRLGSALASELGVELAGPDFERSRIENDPADACDRWLAALAANPDPATALNALGWDGETACGLAARAARLLPEKAAALAKLVPADSLDASNLWRRPVPEIASYWPELKQALTDRESASPSGKPFPDASFRIDPAAAAASFPEQDATPQEITRIIELWAPHDPDAAQEWLDGIPDNHAKAQAEIILAANRPDQNPEPLLELLSREQTLSHQNSELWKIAITRLARQGGDWKSWLTRMPSKGYPLDELTEKLAEDERILALLHQPGTR